MATLAELENLRTMVRAAPGADSEISRIIAGMYDGRFGGALHSLDALIELIVVEAPNIAFGVEWLPANDLYRGSVGTGGTRVQETHANATNALFLAVLTTVIRRMGGT